MNAIDHLGNTALHYLASTDNFNAINEILKMDKVDLLFRNNDDKQAIDLAPPKSYSRLII